MSAQDGRPDDLERIFRAYGEHRLAVAFTDGTDGEAAKRITGSWNRTRPLASAEFAAGLMARCEKRNPAIVLGASGLVGIDIDGPEGIKRFVAVVGKLPPTWAVVTGKGGHLYFAPPPRANGCPAVFEFSEDGVKAWDEKYFVAPPALHPSGAVYHFREGRAPWEVELAELPLEALEAMRHAAGERKQTNGGAAGEPIPEGGRNDALFRMACAMRRRGFGQEAIREALTVENAARCRPPLADEEVEKIAESAGGYAPEAEPEPDDAPTLSVVPLGEFVAQHDEAPEPLIGTADDTVLPAGGTLVFYGTAGSGKTTLAVDASFHLAAGSDWLGLPVGRRCRVLIIENEGPRAFFRRKLADKGSAWSGRSVDGHLFVAEEPWARFTLADEAMRRRLVELVAEHEIDVVVAGPVHRLGVKGGGTPEEVIAFAGLIESVRAGLERPLAMVLAHHTNKAGAISGAWEPVPDTLAHVRGLGHGATRVEWEKVRWGSELHGRAWKLLWREGETYELEEAPPEVTDEDIRAAILAVVGANPGCSSKTVEEAVEGRRERVRETRDALIDEGELVNLGGGKGGVGGGGMRLYLAADVPEQGAFAPGGANGGANGSPPPEEGPFARSPRRKEGERRANGSRGSSDNWCARCERVLEATHPGQPYCHCQDEADEYADRFGGPS